MKVNRTLLKIAIICTALSDAGTGATTPALASIAAAMPDVPTALIQMISSVTALFMAITPIAYSRFVIMGARKRTLLGISAALFLIGGMGPYLFHSSIWVILFFRALLGIASGISIPLSVDLVVDFYEDKERRTMTGFVSAAVGISGVVFQLLGGWLAGINWTYTFLAYGVSIVFVITWMLFLPEPPRAEKLQQEQSAGKVDTKLGAGVYAVAALFLMFFLLWYIMPNNGAMVLLMEGMAVPAQIGAVFTMITVGSFFMSILHGTLFRIFKFALLPMAFFSLAIGLYLCNIAVTLPLFTAGVTFTGIGMGIMVPATMTKVTCMTSYAASPKAVSLCYFAMGMGGFLQPIVFNFFGENGVGRVPFLYGTVAVAVCAVLMIIVNKATASSTYVSEFESTEEVTV